MVLKVLPFIGTAFAMIAFMCVPGLIEEGYFLYGFITLFLSIGVGIPSLMYLDDPNEIDE